MGRKRRLRPDQVASPGRYMYRARKGRKARRCDVLLEGDTLLMTEDGRVKLPLTKCNTLVRFWPRRSS